MTMNYPIIPDLDTQAAILYGIDKYLREVIRDEEIFMTWLELGCPDGCCSINDVRSCLDPDGETFREWIELANRLLKDDSESGTPKPPCEARGCGYWYQDEDESYPSCHCPDDGFPAPCEEEDDEPDDIDDDCGFDPYEGCFTYDC